MKQTAALLVLMLLCSACAYTPPRDIDSPFFAVPVGSKLILNHPLEIAYELVAVGLSSAGDPPPEVPRYQRDAACELEVRTRLPRWRTIEPDEFIVTRVVREITYVGTGPLRLAGLEVAGTGSGPGWEIHHTIMYVHSARQPDVLRVSCRYNETLGEGEHLTARTIGWALGGDFTLELAQ